MRQRLIKESRCCNATVTVEGKEILFYRCVKCGKPTIPKMHLEKIPDYHDDFLEEQIEKERQKREGG